eukprot:767436-Hanusia_phi.AAC.9
MSLDLILRERDLAGKVWPTDRVILGSRVLQSYPLASSLTCSSLADLQVAQQVLRGGMLVQRASRHERAEERDEEGAHGDDVPALSIPRHHPRLHAASECQVVATAPGGGQEGVGRGLEGHSRAACRLHGHGGQTGLHALCHDPQLLRISLRPQPQLESALRRWARYPPPCAC